MGNNKIRATILDITGEDRNKAIHQAEKKSNLAQKKIGTYLLKNPKPPLLRAKKSFMPIIGN